MGMVTARALLLDGMKTAGRRVCCIFGLALLVLVPHRGSLAWGFRPSSPALLPRRCPRPPTRSSGTLLSMTLDELTDSKEETLLCVHLQWIPSSDYDPRQSGEILMNYTRSFPFAAVLPVQPLTYLPTPDGVEVTFLRKKTETKPTNDGGIRFTVQPLAPSSSSPAAGAAASTAAGARQDSAGSPVSLASGAFSAAEPESRATAGEAEDSAAAQAAAARSWMLTARRNAEGQSIAKLFSEKIIVQEFLDGLTGASQKFFVQNQGIDTASGAQPRDALQVTSVYHKWLSDWR